MAYSQDIDSLSVFYDLHTFFKELNTINTKYAIVLMQYTGLKDKNGKEIYEGDILKDEEGAWVVFYDAKDASFALRPIEDKNDTLFYTLEGDFEIIGNIYENGELLKWIIAKKI